MKISELAELVQTQIETIRYYEREGLLPAPRRSENNYRIYDRSHAERLSFIRQCRALNINLDEIRLLLRFKDAPSENCAEVNHLLDQHIADVAQRIQELRALNKELRSLRIRCDATNDAAHCGILKQLSSTARSVASRSRAKDVSRSTETPRPLT